MNKVVIAGVVGCLILCLSYCGSGGPTAPTGPAVAAKAVNAQQNVKDGEIVIISSKSAYSVGESETFKAIPPGGTWASDTPAVATVNEDGLVTIVGQGFANISYALKGLTGVKQIWGRVDIRGSWSGTYSIVHCLAWEDFLTSRFCETYGGSGLPVGLVLTQEGETLRGTITLGDLSTPCKGLPLLNGSLEMEGDVFSAPYDVNVAIGCDYTPTGPEFVMNLYYTGGGLAGHAQVECRISLTKTGA